VADELLDYAALLGTLADRGVEFVLIGGLAVNVHGVIRATADADLVPDPDRANLERLSGTLGGLEAHAVGADPALGAVDAEKLSWGDNWKFETRHGPLHIVQSQPGLPAYRDLRERAIEVTTGDLRLVVCSYEDLVAMKRAADRPQDQIDLADLRAAREERE
jgi:uncharacterized nucleotidyltransferase DUF6036